MQIEGKEGALSSMKIQASTCVCLEHRQVMSLFAKEMPRAIRSGCMLGRTKTVADLEQGHNQARTSEHRRLHSPN